MKNIKYTIHFIVSIGFAFFVLMQTALAQTAPTQTAASPIQLGSQQNNQPNIQTYTTATSSMTVITSPAGYNTRVISTYDGNQFHTFATSTPLTANDIETIQANIQSEESAVEELFQAQQNFFNSLQMMQTPQPLPNFWTNFGAF